MAGPVGKGKAGVTARPAFTPSHPAPANSYGARVEEINFQGKRVLCRQKSLYNSRLFAGSSQADRWHRIRKND